MNQSTRHFTIIPLLLTLLFTFVSVADGQEIDAEFYRDQIKPILSNNCYTCHGPDENTREGGFRFDIKKSAFGPADSGEAAIVPQDLESSELMVRIHAIDDSRMPPADQERQLTDEQRTLLEKWIAAGAPWQEHWSFLPVKSVPVPPAQSEAENVWSRNEIDRFVIRKLREKGITPSAEADRATLLRRLSLDLTGLPPTVEQTSEFLGDDSDDAYEKAVDRLLDSPHYGEHMAGYWLDSARFADTNGYQNDFARKMWPWRDWVINAFNANMPFDQFTVEQIAGDMLPDATLQQKIASGFNRNNRSVTEGGSIEEEWHVENVIDRVETTSTVFLGLTLGCARCHDHKYDPVSQREFYEFYAYFNSSKDRGVYNEKRGNFGPMLSVATPEQNNVVRGLENKIKSLKEKQLELSATTSDRQQKWETEFAVSDKMAVPDDFVGGFLMSPSSGSSPTKASELSASPESLAEKAKSLGDKLSLATAPFRAGDTPLTTVKLDGTSFIDLGQHFEVDASKPFTLSAWVKASKYGAILSRMDEQNDYRGFDLLVLDGGRIQMHLIHKWPINAIKVTANSSIALNEWTHVTVTYDGSEKAKGVAVFIDDQPVKFKVDSDTLAGSTLTDHPLWIGLRAHTPSLGGEVSDVRLYDRVVARNEVTAFTATRVRSVVAIEQSKRDASQSTFVNQKFLSRYSREEKKVSQQIESSKRKLADYRAKLPTTMVMEELPQPRKTFLLDRGLYDQPDKSTELKPGVPAFLPQPDVALPRNRLGLAKWLVHRDNPLTSRVTVNRLWTQLFGAGLVETPENYGVQSPTPSHPELLDWLAAKFVDSKWDVKAFQKMIVMSSTYRQSSRATENQIEVDPVNRWLGRGARYRLSAEMIRDNALAISGLLSRRIGGPSIKPYQPAGVWKELAGGAGEKPYVQDKGEDLYRRSMYIYRKRTVPHPTMSTFDAGSREVCQVARQRTNTPLQALALLNDKTYVEAARQLAVHCIQTHESAEDQVTAAFEMATLRQPNKREFKILLASLERYRSRFEDDMAAARLLLSVGEAKIPEGLELTELAAMSTLCSAILALDETITRE